MVMPRGLELVIGKPAIGRDTVGQLGEKKLCGLRICQKDMKEE